MYKKPCSSYKLNLQNYFIGRKLPLFFILLFFIGCEQENFLNPIENNNYSTLKYKILSNQEVFTKSKVAEKLMEFKQLQTNNLQARGTVFNEEYNFIINTDIVKYIYDTESGNNSYNFPIKRPNSTETDSLENFVLNLNRYGKYDAFIVKYGFTKNEYQEIDQSTLESKNTQFTSIDFDISTIEMDLPTGNAEKFTQVVCVELWVLTPCDEGNNTGNCNGYEWVNSSTDCTFLYTGGGGGDSGGGPPDGGGSSGGGGGSSNNGNTPPDEGNEILISPVLEIDPCPGDPIKDPEVAPQQGASGIKGALFGCTRYGGACQGDNGRNKKHDGIDILNSYGSAVYAMYSGTVHSSYYQPNGAGYVTRIRSEVNGEIIIYQYFHMQEENRLTEIGSVVEVGDVVGYQGRSGNLGLAIDKGSVESHVHIKLSVYNGTGDSNDYANFNSVNPADYLNTEIDENGNSTFNENCN